MMQYYVLKWDSAPRSWFATLLKKKGMEEGTWERRNNLFYKGRTEEGIKEGRKDHMQEEKERSW
jgi:hypothetical protein